VYWTSPILNLDLSIIDVRGFDINKLKSGGGVGSFHSRSRQSATLNLPEFNSAIASFLIRMSSRKTEPKNQSETVFI
jgi:hypothetical protein